MKIVFMGTPEFAVPALSAIASRGHEVRYVVTQRDKARGRGNKIRYAPVKERAVELGAEILQPEKLSGDVETVGKIAECRPDMIIVAAYGQILPPDVLNIPPYGCLNIHASLLPRWRGAAPVQRAVMEGDEATGVSIMQMAEGLDTGDVIISETTAIGGKTAVQLLDELSLSGAKLITDAMDMIENGAFTRTPQDESLATYAARLLKTDGVIDFTNDPEKIGRLVRGAVPWPGAHTFYKGEMMKVWEAFPINETNRHEAGTITGVSGEGIEVSAGGKSILMTEIQMPGKKRMSAGEYLKGNLIEKFLILG